MEDAALRILVVEDNPGDLRLVRELLGESRSPAFTAVSAGRLCEALEALDQGGIDAVLLDLGLPDSSGLGGLERIAAAHPAVPMILLTGQADEDLGLLALHKGAGDYIEKGQVSTSLLARSINYSIERKRVEAALVAANAELSKSRAAALNLMRDAVAARRQAEQAGEALRESEERFKTLADAMPQLAWIARPDGFIFWYNRRWHEYTGTTPEHMEGWGWQSVHDPAELPKVLERWKGSIATGEPFEMTFPLRGADGVFRSFLTRGFPLKDASGRVAQWFGTNTDVDDLKRAEEAVRRQAEELRASNAELERFNRSMVDRELRMVELKKQVNELRVRLGEPPLYPLDFEERSPA